ncbi:MAG: pectate lyase, partial [Armatimonadota bacterium]
MGWWWWVRSGDANIFADGRPHCLAALCRTTEGMIDDKALWPKQGLALSLRKSEGNTMDLTAHVGGDEWNWDAEEAVVASADVSGLAPAQWHHLAFSWDFESRGMWLIVDDMVVEGEIPGTVERPHEYLAAIFGNTYEYRAEGQEPLDGMMDEIAILSVPWPEAQQVMAANAPLTAARPEDPTWTAEATLFPEDENLARIEQVARQHLKMMLETQRHGGWVLNIKWPSKLQWTAKYRMPEPRNQIWLSKDSHTAFGAAEMLFAYEAMGDERYLEAAKATVEMYLTTQHPQFGLWHHAYFYEDGEYIPEAGHHALIQDHAQTGPLLLLCYLHRVTGEQKYLDAAKKGADFLITAQNPNDSWPHHWLLESQTGVTARGIEGGGEVNDYGTSGPVQALLNMHEYTGDERYREAALRGADWLVEAFIDTGELAGWAGQYDAQNNAVEARHFEPPSVTQYAARWAAGGLYAAYRETGDEKYLTPMERVLEWFDENAVMVDGEEAWWWDYEVETGRPIRMYRNEIYYLDDPEDVQEIMEITAADKPPRPRDRVNVPGLRKQYE